MPDKSLYDGREQSRVKHFILSKYLERFAHIVGTHWEAITYVDCFAGPWNTRSDNLNDSSFAIAVKELQDARDNLREHGRELRIRCVFLEKNASAYLRLREFADSVNGAEIETYNKELADAMTDVLGFIDKGSRAFPFIFIDPTGWGGLDMDLIRPLLCVQPGEVLINFMTDFIRRFIESPQQQTAESFDRFFGDKDVRNRIQALEDPQDREDELFLAYAASVRFTGNYKYSCAAIILHPEVDRSYFHLIYATRNRKGVEVFKEVEKQAVVLMENSRADAQQRKRIKKTKQRELFDGEYCHQTHRVEELRERYLAKAKAEAEKLLQTNSTMDYDAIWDTTMAWPLVWDSDLKEWIASWRKSGHLEILGMKLNQRVPKLASGNRLKLSRSFASLPTTSG